jgi:UrcA family protein
MNIKSIVSGRSGRRHVACGAAILTALFGVVPLRSFAEQPATSTVSSVAEVPLADLNLSSAEGMRQARERLHLMAERVCTDREGGPERHPQPGFGACVDSTVASALRRIEALKHDSHLMVRKSVTVGEGVSLADLDLSTLEGAHIARQRLESMARQVCDQLSRRRDLTYHPDYAACLHETLTGALAQADAIAAARNRIAQRSTP